MTVSFTARELLAELDAHFGQGHLSEAEQLHFAASYLVECLRLMAKAFPEEFAAIARKQPKWPVHMGFLKDHQEEVLDLLTTLEVGKKGILRVNREGKQWSLRTPQTYVMVTLVMQLFRSDAFKGTAHPPKLTRKNYLLWWQVLKPIFLQNYGKEFQNHPIFSEWKQKVQNKGLSQSEQRLWIRRDILNKMRQALRSIAHKD